MLVWPLRMREFAGASSPPHALLTTPSIVLTTLPSPFIKRAASNTLHHSHRDNCGLHAGRICIFRAFGVWRALGAAIALGATHKSVRGAAFGAVLRLVQCCVWGAAFGVLRLVPPINQSVKGAAFGATHKPVR